MNTVFVKLLASNDQSEELWDVLKTSIETIDAGEVEPILVQYGHYWALVILYRRSNDEAKLLQLWSKSVCLVPSCLLETY